MIWYCNYESIKRIDCLLIIRSVLVCYPRGSILLRRWQRQFQNWIWFHVIMKASLIISILSYYSNITWVKARKVKLSTTFSCLITCRFITGLNKGHSSFMLKIWSKNWAVTLHFLGLLKIGEIMKFKNILADY